MKPIFNIDESDVKVKCDCGTVSTYEISNKLGNILKCPFCEKTFKAIPEIKLSSVTSSQVKGKKVKIGMYPNYTGKTTTKTIKIKALEHSIKLLEKVYNGKESYRGYDNDGLCIVFYAGGRDCENCPIVDVTDDLGCEYPPSFMGAWWDHFKKRHPKEDKEYNDKGYKVLCETCKKLVKKQIVFLEKLLENEKP